MDNIIIVCDDNDISSTLKSNLMLLRQFDLILSCDLLSAEKMICQNNPKLIIYYSNKVDSTCLDFINKMSEIPIFFVSEDYDDESLLSIYEAGIADYVRTSCSKTEFLIKIMSCLKKSLEINKSRLYGDILKRIGIINGNNEFYSKKYTPAVFKSILEKYQQQKVTVSVMAVAPDINVKIKCNMELLATVLKQNLREDDLIGFGSNCLYVLLPNTNQQGALEVYNKIKKIMESSYTVSAGIIVIEDNVDYNIIIKKLDEVLDDALSIGNTAVVQEDLSSGEPMNWLDKPNKKHKSFKLFKKTFMKKLETVITPVFYQKQQIAEQRLFETKIEQYVDEKKSVFSIEKGNLLSKIEITYPGTVRINIDVYENYNENKEPVSQSFDFSQINQNLIGEILDKLIRDFQRADK